MARIYDMRTNDGSRHFGSLTESYNVQTPQWYRLRDHVAQLQGAVVTGFATDDITEAWIDFRYAEQSLSMNNQNGEWWFFVADPACPESALAAVLDHFEVLLAPLTARARAAGPLAPLQARVLVIEPDGRAHHRDFDDVAAAQRYADDVRREADDDRGPPLAIVFDTELNRL